MTRSTRLVLLTSAIALAASAPSAAQVVTYESDRPALGLAVGRAAADAVETARGPMWDVAFELPVMPTWRIRADVGHAHFHLEQELNDSRYPQRSNLTRVSATVVRTTPYAGSMPVSLFAGGGAGLYRLSNATPGNNFHGGGAHGLAGIEILIRQRAKIVGELRIDLLGGGGARNNNASLYALQGSAVIGVRWILPDRQSRVISY